MKYKHLSKHRKNLMPRLEMCIACGNDTYKPGWGCMTCGYVGD